MTAPGEFETGKNPCGLKGGLGSGRQWRRTAPGECETGENLRGLKGGGVVSETPPTGGGEGVRPPPPS